MLTEKDALTYLIDVVYEQQESIDLRIYDLTMSSSQVELTITRKEFLIYLHDALKLRPKRLENMPPIEPFADSGSEKLETLNQYGILYATNISGQYYVYPDRKLKYAEMIVFLSRAHEYLKKNNITLNEPKRVILFKTEEQFVADLAALYSAGNSNLSLLITNEEILNEENFLISKFLDDNIMAAMLKRYEVFSFTSSIQYHYLSESDKTANLNITMASFYNLTDLSDDYMRMTANDKISEALELGIKSNYGLETSVKPTETDIAKYYYEYVIQNTRYDYESGANQVKTLAHTLYGGATGFAVCAGYAAFYNALLRAEGIETYTQFGDAMPSPNSPAFLHI